MTETKPAPIEKHYKQSYLDLEALGHNEKSG